MNPRKLAQNLANSDESKSVLRGMIDRGIENRCCYCGSKLFLGKLGEGSLIEIKCKKCGMMPCFGVKCS